MDRIFSARLDDVVCHRITDLAHRLHTSKKSVIAQAVECLSRSVEAGPETDVFAQTSGAWKRDEPVTATVERARAAFRDSMTRRQG